MASAHRGIGHQSALPEVFRSMPGWRWFAIAFFLLLIIAALTSSVALLEVPVAWTMARWRWRRTRAAVAIGGLALACGVPVALGYGMLAPAHPAAFRCSTASTMWHPMSSFR